MPDLLSLTNIPTPYRVHFYTALAETLRQHDLSSRVVFMAASEAGRQWTFQPDEWQFDYRLARGAHPMVRQRIFHINPGVLREFGRRPPRWVLMSGSWYLPTVMLALAAARARRVKTLFWSESNLAYVEHAERSVSRWRTRIMNAFDAYVVPGQWARDYVLHYAPSAKRKPIIQLPNVVDEARFRDRVRELRFRREELLTKWELVDSQRPRLLTTARLEAIKGVQELVQARLANGCPGEMTLLIAGEGTLRADLQREIDRHGAGQSIRLLGHRPEPEMLELLAVADGFVLPSRGDPYPLAVVEAMFAGLPLLLSNRVGCHPETLVSDLNGRLFDPDRQASIAEALHWFACLDEEHWRKLGEQSLQLAERRFITQEVVQHFVEELTTL